jgi:hypothetical protein
MAAYKCTHRLGQQLLGRLAGQRMGQRHLGRLAGQQMGQRHTAMTCTTNLSIDTYKWSLQFRICANCFLSLALSLYLPLPPLRIGSCARAHVYLWVLPRANFVGPAKGSRPSPSTCYVGRKGTGGEHFSLRKAQRSSPSLSFPNRGLQPDWVLCLVSYAAWRNTFSRVLFS